MKVKSFLAMAMVALLAASCSDDDNKNIPDAPDGDVKTVEVSTKDYTVWTYLDLETGKLTTATVPGPWKYIGETTDVVQPEIKGEVPAEWDLAFHYYEIKTNDGEAVAVNANNLSDVKTVPTEGFKKDVAVKAEDEVIIVDMSRMMTQSQVGYADGSHNPTLYTWVTRTPQQGMPPVKYEVDKSKVYVVKCKNGQNYKLKFIDCLDGNGKKAVKFSYQRMSE